MLTIVVWRVCFWHMLILHVQAGSIAQLINPLASHFKLRSIYSTEMLTAQKQDDAKCEQNTVGCCCHAVQVTGSIIRAPGCRLCQVCCSQQCSTKDDAHQRKGQPDEGHHTNEGHKLQDNERLRVVRVTCGKRAGFARSAAASSAAPGIMPTRAKASQMKDITRSRVTKARSCCICLHVSCHK